MNIDFLCAPAGISIDLPPLWSGGSGLINGGTVRNAEQLSHLVSSQFLDVVYTGEVSAYPVYLSGGNDIATGGSEMDVFHGARATTLSMAAHFVVV